MRGTAASTMLVAGALVVKKYGPPFYGGGIDINCFEEDGG
jgi:hypothetical protein